MSIQIAPAPEPRFVPLSTDGRHEVLDTQAGHRVAQPSEVHAATVATALSEHPAYTVFYDFAPLAEEVR